MDAVSRILICIQNVPGNGYHQPECQYAEYTLVTHSIVMFDCGCLFISKVGQGNSGVYLLYSQIFNDRARGMSTFKKRHHPTLEVPFFDGVRDFIGSPNGGRGENVSGGHRLVPETFDFTGFFLKYRKEIPPFLKEE